MDLTALTDQDLEALRVDVLNEQDRRRIITEAPSRADQLAQQYESVMDAAPATPWDDLTDRVGPGQRIVWTDGNVYRNSSCAWLPTTATPETYPLGWSQETGLPAEVLPWEPGGTYKTDDLRTFGGIVYRCIQPHTNYDPGHTPNLTPALWAPQE